MNLRLIFILLGVCFSMAMAQTPKPNAVVSINGDGDYTSVQQAIDAAPSNMTEPWIIYIKPGVYKGHVEIPADKPFIYLIGQSNSLVKISDNRVSGGNVQPVYSPNDGATLVAKSSDVYLQGITLENSHGVEKQDGPQALALYTCGDRVIVNNCRLLSYQDTYLTTMKTFNRHYVNQCEIEGGVDFIYGRGDVVFNQCKLNIVRKKGGYIVAPCHPDTTRWGYVFLNTTITAPTANPAETEIWLGRPWHESPRTVFINTLSYTTIPAEGWFDHMNGLPKIWADYNTMNPDGTVQDTSHRRKLYYRNDEKKGRIEKESQNTLSKEEAAQYTIQNVLSGDDNWNPEIIVSMYSNFSN